MSTGDSTRGTHPRTALGLRSLTAAGLLTDAVVHLHLAPGYQQSASQGLGAGTLFRLEAVLAIAAAAYVLGHGSRRAYAVAFLVALSALAAVLVYRYVNLPAIGPLPAMYEPVWFAEKSLSAVAEAVAMVCAAVGLTVTAGRSGLSQTLRRSSAVPERRQV